MGFINKQRLVCLYYMDTYKDREKHHFLEHFTLKRLERPRIRGSVTCPFLALQLPLSCIEMGDTTWWYYMNKQKTKQMSHKKNMIGGHGTTHMNRETTTWKERYSNCPFLKWLSRIPLVWLAGHSEIKGYYITNPLGV